MAGFMAWSRGGLHGRLAGGMIRCRAQSGAVLRAGLRTELRAGIRTEFRAWFRTGLSEELRTR